ncbi:hypothetical protein LSCM1_02016 [Leishmania martiniquensis]|uniref:Roadblock/LAMTOR2 domain-containing protein n=1 Tax=Leishmania martiniquensis TaxID=1580590 RepID=A0A836KFH8_9TRYP|nr:hypothetical protein LSCM1_02016 [Leishmania martiniquensis]
MCAGPLPFRPSFPLKWCRREEGASAALSARVLSATTPTVGFSVSSCATLSSSSLRSICALRLLRVIPLPALAIASAVSLFFPPGAPQAPAHVMSAEQIEGVIEHLTYTKGVLGVVVCTSEGEPIRDSFQCLDRSLAQSYAVMAADLARQAARLFAPVKSQGAVAESCAKEEASKKTAATPSLPIKESTAELIRVRTLLHEIVIRCSHDFLIAIVQEPVN